MTSNTPSNPEPDFQIQANQFIQAGDKHFIAGEFEEALKSYNQALNLFRDHKARVLEADTLLRIRNVHQALESIFFLEATKIYRSIATGEEQPGVTVTQPTESDKKPSWIPPVHKKNQGANGGGVTNGDPQGGVTNGDVH